MKVSRSERKAFEGAALKFKGFFFVLATRKINFIRLNLNMEEMGVVYAEIELINGDDLALVRKNIIDIDEVRRIDITMLVDTGAFLMAINESIQEQMQFPLLDKRKLVLANGEVEEFDLVGPVIVRFKDRSSTCSALILKGNTEPLLGAIPMEDMDVLVHPSRQELVVNPNHPEGGLWRI